MKFFKLVKIFFKRTYLFLIPIVIYLLLSLIWVKDYTNCLFKMVTGLPCPTCGMTRAFISAFSFHFKDSFMYHPLWPLVIIMLLVLFLEPLKGFHKIAHSKLFWLGNLFIFLVVYILRMIYVFPNYPLDYLPNNLINILKSLLF